MLATTVCARCNDDGPTAWPGPTMKRPGGLVAVTPSELVAMQAVLSAGMSAASSRYFIHPGDLAWWVHHADPRTEQGLSFWLGDGVLVVLSEGESMTHPAEISVFALPGVEREPYLEWAQRRMGRRAEVAWVSDDDTEMTAYLGDKGYTAAWSDRSYRWDLRAEPVPAPSGAWELRPLAGGAEADERRRASHGAFESTMDPGDHLQRYLRFMRSPVYAAERDLVALSDDGRIASFAVWWPDASGIAQIEPFGTHPDYQRRGSGRALMYHVLRRMADEGITHVRVSTHEDRPAAMAFYEGVGFTDVGALRNWSIAPGG